MIVLTQKWQNVPNTIRFQSSVTILASTDNYSRKYMIEENAKTNEGKVLDKIYSDMSMQKNYSFMLINKSNIYKERTKIVEPGGYVTSIIINDDVRN